MLYDAIIIGSGAGGSVNSGPTQEQLDNAFGAVVRITGLRPQRPQGPGLEFLHYLTFREAEIRQRALDPSSLVRAERDFLGRHLCKWVPRLQARLAKQQAGPFFPALVRFAATFFELDRAYAAATAEGEH